MVCGNRKASTARTFMGTERTTFLINQEGKIMKIFKKVKPEEGRGLTAFGVAPGALVGTSIYSELNNIPQVRDSIQKALVGKEVTAEIETEAGIF
jgi:hypothetical protein